MDVCTAPLLIKTWLDAIKPTLNSIEPVLSVIATSADVQIPTNGEVAREVALAWEGYVRGQGGRVGVDFYPHGRSNLFADLDRRATSALVSMMEDILVVSVLRDDFLRWAAEEGYPPPAFWDAAPTTTKQSNASPTSATSTKAPRLNTWVAEQAKELKELARKKTRKQIYDHCRDECDGWADRQNGKFARGFSNKTIDRQLQRNGIKQNN